MGIVERKEREKSLKKQAILESALNLFQEKGFLNVTMQDIAAKAEISPGSIYLQYKSKDDIYAAIADMGTQKADIMLASFFDKGRPLSRVEIQDVVRKFLVIYEEFGVYFDVLLLNYRGKKTFPDLSADIVENLREGAIKSLMRVIHYFNTVYGVEDIAGLKTKIMVSWALLLGTSQVLDVPGRKQMLAEGEVEKFIDECALRIENLLFHNECHS